MSKPRKKSVIFNSKQSWQFQKPNDSCQFINVDYDILEGWRISGYKTNFTFQGYVNREDLKNAKDVINLLTDAIEFIDKNIKDGKRNITNSKKS